MSECEKEFTCKGQIKKKVCVYKWIEFCNRHVYTLVMDIGPSYL